MKNILIMGIGRSGKTTLSKMIKERINGYNVIHSDSLKWGIIRAQDQEEYYWNHIDEQTKFERSEYFQKTLLYFYQSLIKEGDKKYGYILESGQLEPKLVKEMIDFHSTIVICLGLGDSKVEDIIRQCHQYDQKTDWTYGLGESSIEQFAKNWCRQDRMLQKECRRLGIKYYDTSKCRMDILNKIVEEIIIENKKVW